MGKPSPPASPSRQEQWEWDFQAVLGGLVRDCHLGQVWSSLAGVLFLLHP